MIDSSQRCLFKTRIIKIRRGLDELKGNIDNRHQSKSKTTFSSNAECDEVEWTDSDRRCRWKRVDERIKVQMNAERKNIKLWQNRARDTESRSSLESNDCSVSIELTNKGIADRHRHDSSYIELTNNRERENKIDIRSRSLTILCSRCIAQFQPG